MHPPADAEAARRRPGVHQAGLAEVRRHLQRAFQHGARPVSAPTPVACRRRELRPALTQEVENRVGQPLLPRGRKAPRCKAAGERLGGARQEFLPLRVGVDLDLPIHQIDDIALADYFNDTRRWPRMDASWKTYDGDAPEQGLSETDESSPRGECLEQEQGAGLKRGCG